jgi:hypothetical protein
MLDEVAVSAEVNYGGKTPVQKQPPENNNEEKRVGAPKIVRSIEMQ